MKYIRGKVKRNKSDIVIAILALTVGVIFGLAIVQAAEVDCHRGEAYMTVECTK